MVVHFLLHARSLTAYEDLISFMVLLGMLPFGLRLGGDDAAWKIARTAEKAVLAGLQQRVQDSPFLAVAIDDSADNKRMEQCCIVLYLIHLGRREEHLIKFHALPGGKATAADICREVAHVLCTDVTDVLDGEDYHVLGLSRSQAASKLVALSSDGAAVMFGKEGGALKRLQEALAPHAVLTWCFTHRAALAGRDMDENAIVAAVKRFAVAVSSDLKGSALRTQQRLRVLAEVLGKEIAILAPQQVRWLSLYTALCNINKQLGPLTVYYFDRAMDGDAVAEWVSNNLTETTFVLMLHGIEGVLAPLQQLTKALQSADSGMPDVIPLVQQAKNTLHEQFLRDSSGVAPDDPGSSCGKALGDLVCNRQTGVNSNFRIQMIKSSDARIAG
jgi:hypothetical protein